MGGEWLCDRGGGKQRAGSPVGSLPGKAEPLAVCLGLQQSPTAHNWGLAKSGEKWEGECMN